MSRELILVVDDNADIRKFVRTALEVEGYRTVEAVDGAMALEKFHELDPDLIVLDVTMGQPDGLEVCRTIRKRSMVPIIMLTSRGEEMDEAMCLAIGADDFITKPTSPRILALRVATQIRHRKVVHAPKTHLLSAGTLTLNLDSRELDVANRAVPLTRTEFDFLRLLMEQPTRVFTREQIIDAIGASVDFSSDKLLDTHASRIRIKVREAGGPKVLLAVRGFGYRLMSIESLKIEP